MLNLPISSSRSEFELWLKNQHEIMMAYKEKYGSQPDLFFLNDVLHPYASVQLAAFSTLNLNPGIQYVDNRITLFGCKVILFRDETLSNMFLESTDLNITIDSSFQVEFVTISKMPSSTTRNYAASNDVAIMPTFNVINIPLKIFAAYYKDKK